MEPWNEERHVPVRRRGAVWRDCGQGVPGLLKDDDLELQKARPWYSSASYLSNGPPAERLHGRGPLVLYPDVKPES